MPTIETPVRVPKRLHIVRDRRLPLQEEQHEAQVRKGLFTMEGGEPFAIPVDRLDDPTKFLQRDLWRWDNVHGTYRKGARFKVPQSHWQERLLKLGAKIHPDVPYWHKMLTMGHDVHSTMRAALFAEHWHAGWVNPFIATLGEERLVYDEPHDYAFETNPAHPGHVARRTQPCPEHARRRVGFVAACNPCEAVSEPRAEYQLRAKMLNFGTYKGFSENLGLLNRGLMTQEFDSEIIDELFDTASTEFADFDFHEVGTNAGAEVNNQTVLLTPSGIARVSGTPVDEDPDYANDATITADATESWEEHGLFNNLTGAALMDRNTTGGQAVNSSDQVTYQGTWTFTPET